MSFIFEICHTCSNFHFSDWRRYVADEIQKRICRLGEPVFVDTLDKITNICRKTVEDLSLILNELEDYQDKVHPEDQSISKKKYYFDYA